MPRLLSLDTHLRKTRRINMDIIYCIEQKHTGKKYIGSSMNPKLRKRQHYADLRHNRHYNKYLQNSFNKYGEDNFEWIVIENVDNSELLVREKYWTELNNSTNRKYGFNIALDPLSPMKGRKASVKTKKLLSSKKQGEKHPLVKINEETVKEIFLLHQEGKNCMEISKMFNIHHTNVSYILNGKGWKHLKLSVDKIRLNNKSGCIGVYQQNSGKWKAEIIKNKKYTNLGSYEFKSDAISARKKAEVNLGL